MSKAKNSRPVGRPPILTPEERKARAVQRQLDWRKKHPHSWQLIYKRAYAKRKAKRLAERGVHVDLNLSELDVVRK
jgi:hypothetical protein